MTNLCLKHEPNAKVWSFLPAASVVRFDVDPLEELEEKLADVSTMNIIKEVYLLLKNFLYKFIFFVVNLNLRLFINFAPGEVSNLFLC